MSVFDHNIIYQELRELQNGADAYFSRHILDAIAEALDLGEPQLVCLRETLREKMLPEMRSDRKALEQVLQSVKTAPSRLMSQLQEQHAVLSKGISALEKEPEVRVFSTKSQPDLRKEDPIEPIFVFSAYDNIFCCFEGGDLTHVLRDDIRALKGGDAFVVGEAVLVAQDDAHQNLDEPDEPWIVYDTFGNGWFEEDLSPKECVLGLPNTVCIDRHVKQKHVSKIISAIEKSLLEQLSKDNPEPFRDICAEAAFPPDFHPGHTLVVWGEDNDEEDRFFSVSVYRNDMDGNPDVSLNECFSEDASPVSLAGTIAYCMITFDMDKRLTAEKQKIPLEGRIRTAQDRADDPPANLPQNHDR